ncbi:hypothetical protein H8D36_03355 [archaeon]|nr:hypothetical protein [archaeon]
MTIIQSPVGPEFETIKLHELKDLKEREIIDIQSKQLRYYKGRHIQDSLKLEAWKLNFKELYMVCEQLKFNYDKKIFSN